jgi:hypothetical protein
VTVRRKESGNLMREADIVVKHESNIDALVERLSHAEERISQNEGRVASLENTIGGVGAKIDDLRLIVKGDYVHGQWQAGLRDKIEEQGRDIAQLKRPLTAAVAGVWTIALGIIIEIVNSYFGLWGAAHAALHK